MANSLFVKQFICLLGNIACAWPCWGNHGRVEIHTEQAFFSQSDITAGRSDVLKCSGDPKKTSQIRAVHRCEVVGHSIQRWGEGGLVS